MTAIIRLSRFIAEAQLPIDASLRTTVRAALIDTLGCILAGVQRPVALQTRQAISSWGGGSSEVFGTTLRLAPPWAAMANAVAGHALDLDDWELPGNTHPSVILFPAMLAIAAERPTPGEALVDAYLVGFEVIVRLGEAMNFEHYERGWHSTATLGLIGVTAAVARLLGLDQDQVAHALSIAVSQAAGYTCQFGSNAKPLQAGFAAKSGLVAASLAAHGLTGQPHVLDAPTGFNALMGHGDKMRFAAPFDRLGDPLALSEHGLLCKPYPSCGYTHRLIDCALAIRSRSGFSADRIAKIRASLPDFHAAVLPFHTPQNLTEALFSAAFCIAFALERGQMTLSGMDDEPWRDPAIAKLNAIVEIGSRQPKNPALNYDSDDPDWLLIEMADGERHYTEVAFPLGSPQNPLSLAQIQDKFIANANAALLARLMDWDTATDIRSVITGDTP